MESEQEEKCVPSRPQRKGEWAGTTYTCSYNYVPIRLLQCSFIYPLGFNSYLLVYYLSSMRATLKEDCLLAHYIDVH